MKQKIKNNWWIALTFILIFIFLYILGFGRMPGDPISHYGFSTALLNGQIPYRDFNVVTTPLYMFYMSIGLRFFNNFIVFLIEHALLVTITYYFIYKIYGKKSILLLPITIFTQFINIIPTYNFMCFAMIIIIVYLEEKYPNKDYLIGFFIALAILSKHTVGCFMIIPSILFYYKSRNKLFKRFIGLIIPILIFIIYLVINNSLYQFIDLCFFGLFDFINYNGATKNKLSLISIIIILLCFILPIFAIIKDKKNIKNFYLFFSIVFMIPIFDMNHIWLSFTGAFITIIPYIKSRSFCVFSLISSIVFEILAFNTLLNTFPIKFSSGIKHFEYAIVTKNMDNYNKKQFKYFDKYDNPIFISYDSIKYKISRNKRINYFDVPLNGNFGYNGNKKMINKIKKMHNQIIIISEPVGEDIFSQYTYEVANYVINNCKKIDENNKIEVYYKK